MDDTLEKWFDAKQKIQILEQKIERYKKVIQKKMNEQHTNKIKEGAYTIERRSISRKYISKNSMPSELWTKYATATTSDAFYISKK